MSKLSKSKGKRGELELAHKLRSLGYVNAHRSQQYCGSASSADVVGLPYIHIECKRTERLSIYKAYAQACRDAGNDTIPVVMHRQSNKPWLVIMSLEDWSKLYNSYI